MQCIHSFGVAFGYHAYLTLGWCACCCVSDLLTGFDSSILLFAIRSFLNSFGSVDFFASRTTRDLCKLCNIIHVTFLNLIISCMCAL